MLKPIGPPLVPEPIVYPESDGLPMADNSKQMEWIVSFYDNLKALFSDRAEVWVGGNMFWYPVETRNDLKAAPDVFVVFGRPKGHRSSYRQWEEGDVPMTVVFEILSPSNTYAEMDEKYLFYEDHGADEYYVYNPETNRLTVFHRQGEVFRRLRPPDGAISPRLGIRFDLSSGPEMKVFHPDGQPFMTYEELMAERARERRRADNAEQERDKADQRADKADQRAARLAELGRKVRRGQATEEELRELERLEQEASP